jgi:hypothetical protein
MNDDNDKIVSLLTEIRDSQREALALQKITALRHKRGTRVYYTVVAILVPISIYYVYLTFHH